MDVLSIDPSEYPRLRKQVRELLNFRTPAELDAAVSAAEREIPDGLPNQPELCRFRESVDALQGSENQRSDGVLRARAREIVRWRRARAWLREVTERQRAAIQQRDGAARFASLVEVRVSECRVQVEPLAAQFGLADLMRPGFDNFRAAGQALIATAQGAFKCASDAVAIAQAELDQAPDWLIQGADREAA